MPADKLTSIIILAYNQLEYTKLCIESIFRCTLPPFELILIDNGSTDSTAEYFDTIVGAKVITNETNLGFAKGCNQGIEVAQGDYILLLNNDTVATERWLDNLIECIESDPSIGIVGPVSNYSGYIQTIETDIADFADIDRFAREFNRQGYDKWFQTEVLSGFCMLIKREVIDKVGLFDERFAIGNFEDDDFCTRTKIAGYRLVCAGNTFIYHFGGRTFTGNQLPYDEIYEKNLKAFNEKWQVGERDNSESSDIKNLMLSFDMAMYTKVALASQKFEAERGELSKLFHQGLIYYVDGKYNRALKVFTDITKELPSSVYPQHALGLTLMMLGRLNEAGTLFKQLLEQEPDDISVLLAYGDCLAMLGDLNAAEKQYKEVLKREISCVAARVGLAVIESARTKPELIKFIKDLDALVNVKTQLAKEHNEHFTVTYLTVNHKITGGPKIYFEHINRLIERGHEVHAVSYWAKPEWFDLRAGVIEVPYNKELCDYVPASTDVVISTFWSQTNELLNVDNVARAYFAQGDRYLFEKDESKRTENYSPRVQQLADINHMLPVSLLVVSQGMQELMQEYYDREAAMVPNAIDLEVFKPGRRRKRKTPKLMMMGADDLSFKGLGYINEAFQRIKSEREVEVVWVSPVPRTSGHITCDTFIQAPQQSELAKIYADCDVFVSASIYESFSLPPIEAMACGTPVVIAVNEGTKGYVKDGKNCVAVPIRDADAIYNAVNRLLDDDLLRERVIKGGLETAARYSWQRAIDILEDKLWYLALSPRIPYVPVLPEEADAEYRQAAPTGNTISDYYRFHRPDIVELVPTGAQRILDVGCAAGAVGKALKERGAAEVVGIEVVQEVAQEAARYLDRVIAGDIEQLDLDYEDGHFDCIIFADVLEHLYNPWQVLAKLKRVLAADGRIICSIPNIGHASVVRGLLNGSWSYEEAGILDITHVRFFTLEGAFALLNSAGFTVDGIVSKTSCTAEEEQFLAQLSYTGLASDDYLRHASTVQFLLTATPVASEHTAPLATPLGAEGNATIDESRDSQEHTSRPKLSLAMIVKDEADNLGRCLKSVQGVVDEVVVVDTGSTDSTVEIAHQFGAKVVHYAWQNDFSAARNVSLDHATGEWVMFLDADEELVAEDIDELRSMLEDTEHEGFYFNEISFVGDKEDDGAIVNLAFRLWRHKPEYRFTGAIHEQIVAKIQSHNPNIGFTKVRINHYGYMNRATEEKDKVQRNLKILLEEVERYPDDPFVRFNIGVEYLRMRDYEEALHQYKKAFANLSGLDAAYASMLVRNIGLCLKELKRYDEALKVLKDAKEAYPDYTDLCYLEGAIHLEQNDVASAIKSFKTCLEMGPSGPLHISQTGVGGHMAAHSLAKAYRALGDERSAVDAYTLALSDNPRDCLTLSELGLMLVNREEPDSLKEFLEPLVDMTSEDVLFTLSFVFSQGNYHDISLSYLDVLAGNNSSPSRAAFLTGECLFNLKEYRMAVDELKKVPASSQFYPAACADIAVCRLLMHEYEEAATAIDSIKDDEYRLIRDLYRWLIELAQGQQPSVLLESEREEHANRILMDLMRKFLELEEYEAFEKAAELLGQLNPAPGELSLLLGKIYYDAGYTEMAVEELVSSYESGCADGEAFFILGRTAFNNEFYEEAKTFFYEALSREIEELSLYLLLGRTLIRLREVQLALDILDAGAAKYPESPLIAEIKQSIEALV